MRSTKDYQRLGKVFKYNVTQSGVSFRFEQGTAEIQLIEADIFRFRMTQHASFGSERHWVVEARGLDAVPFVSSLDERQLSLKTEAMGLMVDLEDFTIKVFDPNGSEVARQQSVGWRGHTVRSWWAMPVNAHFYGCGEKVGFIDRRGRQVEMWTTDSIPHLPDTDPMYQSIPFFSRLE
ncbi:MAG TPA: hypothetical protein VHR47_12105 [Bacillota bacterium]|nr:hypothetical protein [Bacillota bacterium]